jgi:hypothetical protein
MTMHHGSAWSGSTIYMESPLPEEGRSYVGLWSMLCQLPTTTLRGEFSGSLLLPLEGMGVLHLCSDAWEWVFPKAFPKKNGIWEWLLLCSWPVPTFGMGQATWHVQHRLIIVYNTLSSVLMWSYFSNSLVIRFLYQNISVIVQTSIFHFSTESTNQIQQLLK